jgi:two-component system, sensor histidine kinase and response regulator
MTATTPAPRRPRLGRSRSGRGALLVIVGGFVVLITAMVGYNALALDRQRDTPLVVNVTERQRALAERYIKDIILKVDGYAADPAESRSILEHTATGLLNGGRVIAPAGSTDSFVTVPRPDDAAVRLKLAHERALIHQLGVRGDKLLAEGKDSPAFARDLQAMRVKGAQLSSVTGDAAAEEAIVAHTSISRLVWVEVVLGTLGAIAAIGMGLLLWRSGKRQSARFRSLVHNSSDLITVVDEHAVARYQSPSSMRVLGYDPDEIVGTRLTDLLHPNDKSRVIEHFAALFERPGDTTELTFRLRHRNGAWVTMEGTVRNLVRDTTVGGFVVNTRDVTERERTAAELAEARDAAMEASRMKSEFLASMSHEIRTPMNAIIGLSGLILETPLDREQREYATGVQTSADGLLAIINGILDFSKVEAGKIELEHVDFDLPLLVEDVVAMLGEAAHEKDLELLAHCYPTVPRSMVGDPTRLRQVLVNLVSNAVKFTQQGEVVLRVRDVRDDVATTVVRFEVADTGIGIAPEDQERMFDAFSQADSSTTRRFGGTGLGLAIVRQLVTLMGGQLGCESQIDHGSTFWFEIPLERQEAADRPVRSPIPDFDALRVLVVDDNATNRLILREQLSSWGMQPREADNGADALALLHEAAAQGERYDLAVLDLNMPDMDGLELARTIKSDAAVAGTKLFLLSSSGRVGRDVADSAGLSGTLTKPVRQSELFNCLIEGMQSAEGPGDPETEAAPQPDARPRADRGHVLLVEDNAMNQLVATRILDRLGFTVDVAENGRVALEQLEQRTFDAVFMDCQMPEMDGYEATRELRRIEGDTGSHLPVIAMTAAAMDGDREACLAAGMDDYVTKPVRPEDVEQALVRWVVAASQGRTREEVTSRA